MITIRVILNSDNFDAEYKVLFFKPGNKLDELFKGKGDKLLFTPQWTNSP